MGLFAEKDDSNIIELMQKYGHLPNHYEKIRKEMQNRYTSKQIRQRWINYLDPCLCFDPLDEIERSFIVQWVETNHKPSEKIRWKDLIYEMKSQFGKLRSHNRIKNFWYSRMRKLAQIENQKEVKEVNHELEFPSESSDCGYYITLSTLEPTYYSNIKFPYGVKPKF